MSSSLADRDKTVDAIKGMGIVCMVAGHCAFPFTHFIYLFHMAIFFIASGYCYKHDNSNSITTVIDFISRKFKSLWLPYVLWTTFYTLCHNIFLRFNIYTDNPLYIKYIPESFITTTHYWSFSDMAINIIKACFLQGNTQMGGAFWFIAILMEISIAFCVIDFIVRLLSEKYSVFIQGGVASVFLFIGFICSLKEYTLMGFEKFFSYYSLFYVGYLLKLKNASGRIRNEALHIINLTFCFVVLLVINNLGSISLHINSYVNPLYLLTASITGWQFLYELAVLLQKIPFIEQMIICIGNNTMAVVVLHFLCFKIVNYIGVIYEGSPLFLVAAFPFLYSGSLWWLAYLTAGLGIPVCLSLLWRKAKRIYIQTRENKRN